MSFRLIILFFAIGTLWNAAQADTTHIIQRGETLYSVSQKYSVNINSILKTNPGINPQKLRIGQSIRIPGNSPSATPSPANPTPLPPQETPSTYVVQEGENVASISRKFNIPVEEIKARNDLVGTALIPGQKILLRTPTPVTPKVDYTFLTKKVRDRIDAPNNLRPWKYIVVHHSGTPNGNAKIFDYFHSHFRGMENGLAYHFVIGNGTDSGDGEVEIGPRWNKQIQGGHLRSDDLNEVSIGICLVGDFNRKSPTKPQIASLIELVTYLEKKCAATKPKFFVHREINPTPTECPGKLFPTSTLHKLFD